MKISSKAIWGLFLVACTYSACKKAAVVTPGDTSDVKALSSQIAVNLYKSLTGGFGGANINDGVKAPSKVSFGQRNLSANVPVNPLCGYTIDTTFNYTVNLPDTTKTFAGKFNFVYTCDANIVNGYNLYDSLKNVEQSPKFINTYIVAQNYIVKALDQTYKLVSMDGYIHTSISTTVFGTPAAPRGIYHYLYSQYNLSGLHVDVSSGVADIITGTATFYTLTVDLDATTNIDGNFNSYNGTIQFLPNHMAKLTLGGKTYSVNLLTGQII